METSNLAKRGTSAAQDAVQAGRVEPRQKRRETRGDGEKEDGRTARVTHMDRLQRGDGLYFLFCCPPKIHPRLCRRLSAQPPLSLKNAMRNLDGGARIPAQLRGPLSRSPH
jgi:hypothetical protein